MTEETVEDPKLFSIDPDRPVYSMGITSELTGLPMWTLRSLDKEGLVEAQRTEGQTRMYSMNDLKALIRIRVWVKKGLNIAGIRMMIETDHER